MNKYLMVIKIKPEYRDQYIEEHLHSQMEVLKAIREAGFLNEMIWYFEDQSIIYCESEEEYTVCDEKWRNMQIGQEWENKMERLFVTDPVKPEKIFDLDEMLRNKD